MTPAIRISCGMVALTISLLLTADWVLGLFPDAQAPLLESRKDLAESLAIQYTSLVSGDRQADMQPLMEATADQMTEVLSMKLKNVDGQTLAETSEHSALWNASKTGRSTPTHVFVPIFRGEKQWAVLEVRFTALPTSGFLGIFTSPLYKLTAVLAGVGFFVYFLYLSQSLRYLDPSAVVPSRVRAALDQLVEGVIILDHHQHIVLANLAFANKVGVTPEALIGVDPSSLPWVDKSGSKLTELPWTQAIKEGSRMTDERLELQSPALGIRVLTANISPIIDGSGKGRGVLVSFDDRSEIERINEGLIETLNNLEVANQQIHHKNNELSRLANIDPLTECLNRRAFFEKFELELQLAIRDDLMLSVVMADIDHFKNVNDEFGHAVGDLVIKGMAKTLKESTRANDVVARYGGEEFCMLLVGADAEEAKRVSERARLAFERQYQANDSVTRGRLVTASFGVSMRDINTDKVKDILNQADLALYESKSNGRNCVTGWTDLNADLRKAG